MSPTTCAVVNTRAMGALMVAIFFMSTMQANHVRPGKHRANVARRIMDILKHLNAGRNAWADVHNILFVIHEQLQRNLAAPYRGKPTNNAHKKHTPAHILEAHITASIAAWKACNNPEANMPLLEGVAFAMHMLSDVLPAQVVSRKCVYACFANELVSSERMPCDKRKTEARLLQLQIPFVLARIENLPAQWHDTTPEGVEPAVHCPKHYENNLSPPHVFSSNMFRVEDRPEEFYKLDLCRTARDVARQFLDIVMPHSVTHPPQYDLFIRDSARANGPPEHFFRQIKEVPDGRIRARILAAQLCTPPRASAGEVNPAYSWMFLRPKGTNSFVDLWPYFHAQFQCYRKFLQRGPEDNAKVEEHMAYVEKTVAAVRNVIEAPYTDGLDDATERKETITLLGVYMDTILCAGNLRKEKSDFLLHDAWMHIAQLFKTEQGSYANVAGNFFDLLEDTLLIAQSNVLVF